MSDRKTLFADIILPVPIHKVFTYRVPFELNDYVLPGVRAIVPFGRSKLITGIITKVHEVIPNGYQAKYIEHVLDETPIITKNQFLLWQWISNYYMSPLGDVMNAALPSNFKLASETKIVLHPDFDKDHNKLEDRHYQIVEALEIKDVLDLKEISEILGIKTIHPIIKKMIDLKIVLSQEEMNEKFTPKTALYIELADKYLNVDQIEELIHSLEKRKSATKQLESLLLLLSEGNFKENYFEPVLRKNLEEKGASLSSLNTLEKNNIVIQRRYEISRLDASEQNLSTFKTLAPSQEVALEEIKNSFNDKQVTLLHGVTGSGKTEIYVELIKKQLEKGKQVLFLLPEIALTTQLIQRLSAYFGDLIGIYHSKFNQNERVEIWNNVLRNNPKRFRIILGARSSIFLPFTDLGLIIVDEEHESSFKQYDPSPRYNARDCAIVLGHMYKAKVLLGSATPSLESYYNAQNGKYGFVSLKERFGGIQLPEIFCADLKKERKQKSMNSHFSSFLVDTMRDVLNKGEQIILFQNRRGYTPMWQCEICNWTPKCKNCDVSLTYHKQTNSLKCHYCGHHSPPIGTCSACGSNRLKMLGFGTEKIEDELSLMLPDKVIKRMDLDSTRSKNAYSNLINEFENRQIDILIGTQMITKGLDFDNVSLVGILDADMLLNRADFRAFERSYHLMSQVAGRSGRKHKRGQVIIQTGDPDHWVIQKIIDHNYEGFYNSEIIERKNFFYPPFYKIIDITLKHKQENALDVSSLELANKLKEVFKERVLGPEYPVVRRVKNMYLKKITLKIERDAPERKVKERLQQIINEFYISPSNKNIRIVTDVDPA
jgi:primosomal protein N' (replication factor Y) (superfamily II helicase)